MQAVANNPAFAKKVGVPTKVGKEFTKSGGGMATNKAAKMDQMKKAVIAAKATKPAGAPSNALKAYMAQKNAGSAAGARLGAAARSGMPARPGPTPPTQTQARAAMMGGRPAAPAMKKGGVAKYANGGMIAPSKMGSVKTAAPSRDGVAVKGKTKGTNIVMAGSSKGMKKGGAC